MFVRKKIKETNILLLILKKKIAEALYFAFLLIFQIV
jgi:hypothetical protein